MASLPTIFALALTLMVADCMGGSVSLTVLERGGSPVCGKGATDAGNFWRYGVAYFTSRDKVMAAEFNGSAVQCCYLTLPAVAPVAPKVTWRSDYKCGKYNTNSYGEPATCNGQSNNPCCSRWGWCDRTGQHCTGRGSIDYRKVTTTTTKRPFNIADYKTLMAQKKPCSAPDDA